MDPRKQLQQSLAPGRVDRYAPLTAARWQT